MSSPSRTGDDPRASENAALDNLAVLLSSDLTTEEVRLHRRKSSLGFSPTAKRRALSSREQQAAAAEFERLKKKLVQLKARIDSGKHPDEAQHLAAMSAAIIAAEADPDFDRAWALASTLTASVGESEWFSRTLGPRIKARFGRP